MPDVAKKRRKNATKHRSFRPKRARNRRRKSRGNCPPPKGPKNSDKWRVTSDEPPISLEDALRARSRVWEETQGVDSGANSNVTLTVFAASSISSLSAGRACR